MKLLALLVVLLAASTASADKPTLAEAKATIIKLGKALDDDKLDLKAAGEILAAPFWYDDFEYYGSDEKASKACKKKWKKRGTVKVADLAKFTECLPNTNWNVALDAGSAPVEEIDLKKLPKELRKHKTKLTQMAKTHLVVFAHFLPAGPEERWTVFAFTKKDGAIRLHAMVHAGGVYGP